MYAGRVACCLLVSHVEYAPRALLRLKKMGQTDGRQTVYITLTARRGHRTNENVYAYNILTLHLF